MAEVAVGELPVSVSVVPQALSAPASVTANTVQAIVRVMTDSSPTPRPATATGRRRSTLPL